VTVSLDAGLARLTEQVKQVVAGCRDNVAVEVMWPGRYFVGARWGAAEAEEALAGARRASVASARPMGRDVALRALLGTAPSGQAEFAELGAVNAWASTGPLVLWREGEEMSRASVDLLMDSRPDLSTCAHPVAVELGSSVPRPCWVGIVVSDMDGGLHRLDHDAVHQVLATSQRTAGPSR
jgi:hypothetical protein